MGFEAAVSYLPWMVFEDAGESRHVHSEYIF